MSERESELGEADNSSNRPVAHDTFSIKRDRKHLDDIYENISALTRSPWCIKFIQIQINVAMKYYIMYIHCNMLFSCIYRFFISLVITCVNLALEMWNFGLFFVTPSCPRFVLAVSRRRRRRRSVIGYMSKPSSFRTYGKNMFCVRRKGGVDTRNFKNFSRQEKIYFFNFFD